MADTYAPFPTLGQTTNWKTWLDGAIASIDSRLLTQVVASDGFRRPDGAVGLMETGQAWSVIAGSGAITSSAMVLTGTSTVLGNVGVSNGQWRCSITYAGGAPGLVFRAANDNLERLQVQVDGAGALALQKVDAGSTVPLRTWPMTPTTTVTYNVVIQAYGELILVWLDGKLRIAHLLSSTDVTDYGSLTYAGFRATSSGGTFTDFDVRTGSALAPSDITPIRQVTGAYTPTVNDIGYTIEQLDTNPATLTIPANVFPAGSAYYLYQPGTATWTVAAGAGMTLRNAGALAGQFKGATIYHRSLTEAAVL
jgi:hypothetical protein